MNLKEYQIKMTFKEFKLYKNGVVIANFIENPELKIKYGVEDADLDM